MPISARYPSLTDRPVLISGGASGIGEALVRAFCAQGARVAFLDIADGVAAAVCDSVAAEGLPRPVYRYCDLRDIDALQRAIADAAAEVGEFRCLVNNAANDERHAPDTVTSAYWDERMAVNLKHQFFASQAVAPMMRAAGGGSIVNLGSISWKLGQGNMPCYTTAKAAVHGLTRSLARDCGPFGIRVNTVLPGWVMTRRQIEKWLTPEADRARAAGQCLKGRLEPWHIAAMVLFLAADESAMCTAQEFTVDGGWA